MAVAITGRTESTLSTSKTDSAVPGELECVVVGRLKSGETETENLRTPKLDCAETAVLGSIEAVWQVSTESMWIVSIKSTWLVSVESALLRSVETLGLPEACNDTS